MVCTQYLIAFINTMEYYAVKKIRQVYTTEMGGIINFY